MATKTFLNLYLTIYSRGDHNSSAVCVYKKSDIFDVFGGKFRRFVNKTWEILPDDLHPYPRLDDVSIL